ncbi:hypothetical protein J7T55_007863 [Diaporthe amygdali]|uniref:uncharacterized protein n=1 Tax=Phomopsis amygdali TaxID=1214568 RepID=UPI0022FE43B6|nr:uncharacterized protein J7T55_007863 [Diaporthe amygdali]KAJ0114029.1 hypothetical protein J7T55_007863 [Diaporthe amygdali]
MIIDQQISSDISPFLPPTFPTLSCRLTMFRRRLDEIEEARKRAQPLPSGAAPYTSSEFFKVHPLDTKPNAKCWSHRFSANSLIQTDSPLKVASRDSDPLSMITLGTARPSPEYFPWESIEMRCPSSGPFKTPEAVSTACTKGEQEYDLSVAMNYGYSAGSPQVLRFVTEHIEMIHNPPYNDWESSLTCGTTSALEICFRIFSNPGDVVLMEEYSYTGTISAAKAQGLKILNVATDNFGVIPGDLDLQLDAWDLEMGPKPFLLYMIPTGQNPTGITHSNKRRREIYQVAAKHDLYILEDDPYYFLHLGPYPGPSDLETDSTSLDEYLAHLPNSYLSLDVDGRVIRMDTTSKILAPGLRCGWITASSQVIRKFLSYSEVGVLSPSGPSQAMLYKLLDQTWGHEGFIRWLLSLSLQYRERRDLLLQACERFLPLDICSWAVPTSGMFLWIKIDSSKVTHVLNGDSDDIAWRRALQLEEEIFSQARRSGVLISKGSWFVPVVDESCGIYFRLTFAAAPRDELEPAIQRLGDALGRKFSTRHSQ